MRLTTTTGANATAPLGEKHFLYMEFSPRYFEKLKSELEAAGYKVTAYLPLEAVNRQANVWRWFSEPVGSFGVNALLQGDSFAVFVM